MKIYLTLRQWTDEAVSRAMRPDIAALIADAQLLAGRHVSDVARARLYLQLDAPEAPGAEAALGAAMALGPAGIVLRDVANGHDVTLVDARLAVAEARAGLAHGSTRIIAVAGSTPASLFAMESLIGCSPRLDGLVHDPLALARSLGAEDPADLKRIARALTVAAAHAAGVIAIDADAAVDEARAAREGFSGKLVQG